MGTLTEKLTEALGLDAGADDEAIVKAVNGALSERDEAKADTGESLEDRAKAEGKVLIEADQLQDLNGRLTAAEKALTDSAFDKAFDAALDDQRVDAKEETRERFHKLYEQDADTTVQILSSLPKLVNSAPQGKGGSEEIADAPEGVDADSHALDREVRAYMTENSEDNYSVALDKVLAKKEALV